MTKDLLKKLLNYQNKWVALNEERTKILTSGATIKEVERKISRLKVENVVVTHILPKDRLYAPFTHKKV